MSNFLYQTVGGVLNTVLTSLFVILLTNVRGSEFYGEYSLIINGYFFINLMCGMGLSSYLQVYIPKTTRSTTYILFNSLIIKLFLVASVASVYSIFNEGLNLTVILYFVCMSLNQIMIDNFYLYRSYFKDIFYSRLLINILRLSSIVFCKDIITLFQYLMMIELSVLMILILRQIICDKSINISRWNKFIYRLSYFKDYKVRFVKTVYLSNLVYFFSTPTFVILYMGFLDYDLSVIAGFSIVASLGMLAFNILNVNSRFEGALVAIHIKGKDVAETQITLLKISSLLMSVLVSYLYLQVDNVSKYIFSGEYVSELPYIVCVYLVNVANLLCYVFSPYIYRQDKLNIIRSSNFLAFIVSILFLIVYDDKRLEVLFLYLVVYSFTRLFFLVSGTIFDNKKLMKESCYNLFFVTLVSMAFTGFYNYIIFLLYKPIGLAPFMLQSTILGILSIFSSMVVCRIRKYDLTRLKLA
ncbi:hypothetical protein A1QU_09255 [Vibrio anguillarum]|nr:hypothetical protein A1QU_09255 [Vibrio anguillarum]